MDKIDIDKLTELNENMILYDELEDAFIGYSSNFPHVAIYNYDKCVELIQKYKILSYKEALDYIEFNCIGLHLGENTPIFINTVIN